MPAFHYQAINARNEVVEGQLEANGERQAFDKLHGLGLFPIQAIPRQSSWLRAVLDGELRFRHRTSRADLVPLTRQLATLLAANIQLERALELLVEFPSRRQTREALGRVREDVRDGGPLSAAIERSLPDLPPYYVSMVRAGELGGALSESLERLAELLKRNEETRAAIVSQLIYPVILLWS